MYMSIIFVSLFAVSTEGLTTAQKEILDAHNDARANVRPHAKNMRRLKWDDTLANKAQRYADKCILQHNPNRSSGTRFRFVGENLHATTASYNGQNVVRSWTGESAQYRFEDNSCEYGSCGHYTQVIWATTEYVGCGFKKCNSIRELRNRAAVIVVCNYGEAGNWNGQKPYLSGQRCTGCPPRTTCVGSLCTKTCKNDMLL